MSEDIDRREVDFITLILQRALSVLNVEFCEQCGKCTAICPISRLNEGYNPRLIMAKVQLGRVDELLKSDMIWTCTSCMKCKDSCPEEFSPYDIILLLKKLAIRAGYDYPQRYSKFAEAVSAAQQRLIEAKKALEELIRVREKAVLVIGGGIAGIQASLDLADRGLIVHLVEKSPSIGGVMAQLDKTFPTMDCSICILAPKMIECSRHPSIVLHTLSEVVEVTGSVGAFHVKMLERPRYVDASKCTGCGTCTEKCPIKVPSEFQAGLGMRKAIYLHFPQAVPLVASIDSEHCLYFQKGVCRVCEKFCPAGAIDYEQQPREVAVDVSSIIIATGFEQYDPQEIGEYGYKRFDDVITSLEFERLVCASGPTGGRLERPSDKKEAHRIAFVQCVGSRSQRAGFPFCSSVCCMYATKEAVLIKDHDPESEVTIFRTELKVFGKGFQEFVDRARDNWGIKYVRGRPGEVREHPLTGDLIIWYEDTDKGKVGKMEADLVVLCAAMAPRPENKNLADVLGVELDEFGFFKVQDPFANPLETNVPGIYVCGCCHGPRDIPESVAEASAAAAKAAESTRPAAVGWEE